MARRGVAFLLSCSLAAIIVLAVQPMVVYSQSQENGMTLPTREQVKAALVPFVKHLESGCAGRANLPQACIEEIDVLPDQLSSLYSTMINPQSMGEVDFFDVSGVCGACPPDAMTKVYDALSKWFDSSARTDRESCGGIIPGGAINNILPSLQLLMASMCSQSDTGRYCWEQDILPAALDRAGMRGLQTMQEDLPSNGLSANTNPMGLLAQLDLNTICTGLASGGCCVGNALELNKALLKANCMDAAANMADMLNVMCAITAPIPNSCPGFQVPAYKKPDSCPRPDEILSEIQSMVPVDQSVYASCVLPTGICPRNACEMYLCMPASSS